MSLILRIPGPEAGDRSAARALCRTLLGMPLRHRGADVGSFFLGAKEGAPAFTDEDEEVFVLFASQAAVAIANARTYRGEQHARADLEALVETSPVGVVVLDAERGWPVSLNREARRIAEKLRTPGRSLEQHMEEVCFRRADGREMSLGEFPLAQWLSAGKTVRGEDVVLSVAPEPSELAGLVEAGARHLPGRRRPAPRPRRPSLGPAFRGPVSLQRESWLLDGTAVSVLVRLGSARLPAIGTRGAAAGRSSMPAPAPATNHKIGGAPAEHLAFRFH